MNRTGHSKRILMAAAISIAFTIVFILPLCGWMFQCGCSFLWLEGYGYAQCNIHQPGVPHCPWCVERNSLLMALPFLFIIGAQGLVIGYFSTRYRLSLPVLLALGVLTFFIIGIATGYWFKTLDGYPYFFSK